MNILGRIALLEFFNLLKAGWEMIVFFCCTGFYAQSGDIFMDFEGGKGCILQTVKHL